MCHPSGIASYEAQTESASILFIAFRSTAFGKSFFETANPIFANPSPKKIALQDISPKKNGFPLRKAFWKRDASLSRKRFGSISDGEFFSPLSPPAFNHLLAANGLHPLQKAMATSAT
jgi:hypothetical protein